MKAKIGDFGFSRKVPNMPPGYTLVTAVMTVKSLGYSAPELDVCRHSPKSDVYSYGVVGIPCHECIIVNRGRYVIYTLKVILEIFTGQLAYANSRIDCMLVCNKCMVLHHYNICFFISD